jgi:hypothetical protein
VQAKLCNKYMANLTLIRLMRRCMFSARIGSERGKMLTFDCREKLREQHALGEEIAQAITSAPIGEPIDEQDLEDELAELEQEQLDNQMLKTGTVPVSDDVHRLPTVANGKSKY